MENIKDLELGNFFSNGQVYLFKCPECRRENCAINVSTGICTWCGLDGNNYYKDKFKFDNSNI
jgi:hypothetical protein